MYANPHSDCQLNTHRRLVGHSGCLGLSKSSMDAFASREKLSSGFLTSIDTNKAVQSQIMARGFKFRISEGEGFYYLCSKNKALISCAVISQLNCVCGTRTKSGFQVGSSVVVLCCLFWRQNFGDVVNIILSSVWVAE